MKKIILLICFIIVSCTAENKKKHTNNNFSISAEMEGLKDGTKVFLYDLEKFQPIDSTISFNSCFKFKGTIEEPKQIVFFFLDTIQNTNYPLYRFWLDNNDLIIKSKIEDFSDEIFFKKEELKGSPLNEILSDYQNAIKGVFEEKGETAFKSKALSFSMNRPNNFQSVSVVFDLRNSLSQNQLIEFYKLLNTRYRNSSYGKVINNYINSKQVKEGDKYIDIIGENLKGEKVKLSDFKNRVILLDFWSSWCTPCRYNIRNEIPKLKKMFQNEDFVIIGFSLDTNYEHWKRASINDSINWINISDLKGYKSSTIFNYGINEIPRYIIIDKEGIVQNTKINMQNESIEKILKSIFNKKE